MIDKNICKGLLFRATVSSFAMIGDKRKYYQAGIRLSFLKQKSCKGCEHCDWMWEAMSEEMHNSDALSPRDFHDGWIYSLAAQGDDEDYKMYFTAVEDSFGKPRG